MLRDPLRGLPGAGPTARRGAVAAAPPESLPKALKAAHAAPKGLGGALYEVVRWWMKAVDIEVQRYTCLIRDI